MPASKPLYYSYSTISGADQRIYATEDEAKSGDQAWDLNPVIYYRIKCPTQTLDLLPKIDLAKNFKQAEESESISFTILDETINPDVIQAVEITDQDTIDRQRQVLNFTQQQDSELLKFMDAAVLAKKSKIEDCKSVMFPFDRA